MSPNDHGPIYAETVMGRFPVEPWNTFSNLCFLALILYLVIRTRMNFRFYPLVVLALPILTIGFVGGTVYHATRSSNLWLRLDFIPILVLALLASYYFWWLLLKSKLRAALMMMAIFIVVRLPWFVPELSISYKIAIGYSGMALSLIAPAVLLSARERWVDFSYLLSTIICFLVAITCRTIDSGAGATLLPMGTHFLWHTFGALSVFLLFQFILRRYDRNAAA